VTSTKKQKMLISRSIVDIVNTEWNPPGRFLEKQSSGLWAEVNTKKALEKTAQALRDGAFPLRKQLSEDFSDPSFLEAVFDTKVEVATVTDASAEEPAPREPTHPLKSNRGHRRMVSAPVVASPVGFMDPDPKRSKPNSPNYYHQEPDEDMQFPVGQQLTGINFPSPQLQKEELEFKIGTHEPSTKKGHRKNRTFGGYSCSDGNVSELPVDDIFAMFLTPLEKQQHQAGNSASQANHTVNNTYMMEGVAPQVNDGDMPMSQLYVATPVGFNQQLPMNSQANHSVINMVGGVAQQDVHDGGNPMSQLNVAAQAGFDQQLPMNSQQLMHNNYETASPAVFTPLQQQHQAGNAASHAYNGANMMGVFAQQAVQDGGIPMSQLNVSATAGFGQQLQMNSQQLMHNNYEIASPTVFTPLQQQHQASNAAIYANHGANMMGGAPQQAVQDGNVAAPSGFNQQLFQTMQQQLMHNDHAAASNPVLNQEQFQTTSMHQQQTMNTNHAVASSAAQIDPNMLGGLFTSPSPQGIPQHNMAMQGQQMGSSPLVPATNMQPQAASAEQLMKSMGIVFEQTNTTNSFHLQSNLMPMQQTAASNTDKTLSGVKRHRRYNTIAGGESCATHRQDKKFDMDFLNNIHLPSEPLNNQHSMGEAPNGEQFQDFLLTMPMQPSPDRAKGRHRRSNTTGHFSSSIDLSDFTFSLDQPTTLNTIHEEIPQIPLELTADCGSLMSSEGKTGVSSIHDTNESKPSEASINAILNSVIPNIDTAHKRTESSKSSLSNEDFCFHMLAGGEGYESEIDGFVANSS
jgi:hypothetical protein